MTWTDASILLGVGLLTGIINTLAGGGSLITLPVFIFMGLPSPVANATNRIGVFLQSLVGVGGFRSKGITPPFPYSLYAMASALIGCTLGAWLAVDIASTVFNRVLAVVMIIVMALTVLKPYLSKRMPEVIFSTKRQVVSVLIFFFVGFYGGFIQAGVGFLIIATLTGIHGLDMARTNAIKLFVVVGYTLLALIIFVLDDLVRWEYGFTLAVGNSTGGWLASRWSVGKDEKWIRLFLMLTVGALAIKLWFFE